MIKYYCDVCQVELKPLEHLRLERQIGDLKVEVTHTWKGVANNGQICHKCIKDAIINGLHVDKSQGSD